MNESDVLDTVVGSAESLRLHMLRDLGDEVFVWLAYLDHGEEEAVVGLFVPFVGGGCASHDNGIGMNGRCKMKRCKQMKS